MSNLKKKISWQLTNFVLLPGNEGLERKYRRIVACRSNRQFSTVSFDRIARTSCRGNRFNQKLSEIKKTCSEGRVSILPYRDYDEFKYDDTCMFDCHPLVFLTKMYRGIITINGPATHQYVKLTQGGKGTKRWEQSSGCDKGPPIGGSEDHTPVGEPEFWPCGRISLSAVGEEFRSQ
jgi:hypothetical protein